MGTAQSSHRTVDNTEQRHSTTVTTDTNSSSSSSANPTSPSSTSTSSTSASVSSSRGRVNHQSSSSTAIVTDLKQTLIDSNLVLEYRKFLRTNPNLDKNRSDDSDYKKKNEQWLDFVIICEQVFDLPEDENERKIGLMVDIGKTFFAKPPDGYNMVLQNQLNHKELINHCKNLADGVTNEPDHSLLRASWLILGKPFLGNLLTDTTWFWRTSLIVKN